jgi:hypothetical protein
VTGLRTSADGKRVEGGDHPSMTSAPPLHVVPHRLGSWRVQREGDPRPLSEHTSETAAERAAARLAARAGRREIVVHDRYGRVRRATARRP